MLVNSQKIVAWLWKIGFRARRKSSFVLLPGSSRVLTIQDFSIQVCPLISLSPPVGGCFTTQTKSQELDKLLIAFGITNFLVPGLQELCKSWPRLRKVVDVGPVPRMGGMEPSDRTYVASVCMFSNPTIFTNIPKPIAVQTDNTPLLLNATLLGIKCS